MKLDYLIDTNIFISLFNQELTQPVPNGNIGYSVITSIEILSFKGLSLEEENLIRSTLKTLIEVSLDAAIAEKTIQLRRKYSLKIPDAVILASAWECAAVLITNDQQLFKISEVQVISLPTKS
ncbi:type II toxin-antitoxin system VapC family toxin [Anabaenopsis arnoldii]|uniref:Type II toxin-antitoxin system VapC family toxin n=1 Tax=Anabaenopsis arnoldii TaxID=2152938 RepID=A0ABT5AVP9_9CYAN|nr:type II toxin-antitoxin system VapC family toxin [Anabaenopsis arnoldii]MDB9541388.1 type II toxin-antitoxin system VapC family toxin [Anabaenopsis arnoldii]MDH6090367.1 type II toxin-antitoxin system VapC family toxin [Anabaenopsis arnoldii]